MSQYDNMIGQLAAESLWSEQNEKAILQPFTYISSIPGKEIRTLIMEAFNIWMKVPRDKLEIIMEVVRIVHNASLLADDIQDNSQLRRGQPVAHQIFGVAQTMNAAIYIVFQEILKFRSQFSETSCDLDLIILEELVLLHRGQGLDILWRDTFSCPSEEEYISMVNNKTGGLFRLGIKLMMACATSNTDANYVPLVNLIGIYFQVRDDLINLQSSEYAKTKGFAEDLSEGKFFFPIIHGIHANPSDRRILDVLEKRSSSPALKIPVIEYLRNDTKSFAYTHSILDTLEVQIRHEMKRFGMNKSVEMIMDLLHVDVPKSA